MHSSFKRKANPPTFEDWAGCYWCCSGWGCSCFYDDYDDCCYNCCCVGCVAGNCVCFDKETKPHHQIVAQAYADRIITDVPLDGGIRDYLIKDRLEQYGHDYSDHGNRTFKEDLVFAWKMIKDTPEGTQIFASIFGSKE